MTVQRHPVVANTFRGVTREDAQRQAEADVAGARTNGYEPERQDWSEENGLYVLTITYRDTGRVPTPAATVPQRRGGVLGWRKATWAMWIWTGIFVLWIVSGLNNLTPAATEAGRAGQAIGAGLAVTFIGFIWFVGFIVLSVIWFATRPQARS